MSDLNQKSFTIRITEKPDGTLDVWSKGMPDTRTFGGKPWTELPRTHHLGLFALGKVYEAGEFQGWIEPLDSEIESEK